MLNGVHRRQFLALSSVAVYLKGAQHPRSSNPRSVWTARIAHLNKSIPKLMSANNVPGLSIAIINGARIAWAMGFGVKDRASSAPVDRNTVFEAASMSKPVFAYAVMKLREKGILDLDTPLIKYTREPFLAGDQRLDRITARHVLSHTTGFQNTRTGEKPLKIHFNPGEKWMYSGEGYFYLQSAVTALTGRVSKEECSRFEDDLKVCATDFDAHMKTNLLTPFRMNDSGYLRTAALSRNIARPHNGVGQLLPDREPTRASVARYGAMGGLLTTATDYARFLIEILEPKPQDAFRLSRTSLTEMLRPQVKVEESKDHSVWWALGWKVVQTADHNLVSHGGDQTGFHSTSEICPARKSGYVILTNGDNGWKLIEDLAPAISTWVHSSTAQ